ncbi:FAD-dependent oxidoreductase [Cupriavidus sp. CuC1]|uniref:FAD-dependent oxidoreductase n=1 Tax=Cupriavidus sp. CuC1 TaxID=3373131 RepID=UPI0037CE2B6A
MIQKTPVLIVGGGPVGLALAGDLGWRGVKCTLIERSNGVVPQPRMDMVGIRTMEFCRRWGIVEAVEQAGYNRDYPPQSPQKRERCPQNFFDPVLQRFAASTGVAELVYETELETLEDRGDHVIVTVKDGKTGARHQIEAQYLVGCDGGASAVRQALGIGMSGDAVLTYTTNVIFRCDGLERLHTKQPGYRYIFIGPEGTWATLVAINGRDQWRFSLVGNAEKRTLGEEEIRRAIVRAVGREFDFEILSVLPWVRRQLVADHYRKGRVFIAGDAAHLTSPTGGFGMNTGILDVVNLSWKLAGTLQGWGGPLLLDSYEDEQRPVAVRNVTEAGENLRRMLSPRVVKPEAAIFDSDNVHIDAARREYGARYTEMMKREWFSIGIHLGYVYEDSPIVVPDGTSAPPNEVARYTQSARPGSRAPHVWLSKGKSTLDLFGKHYVLLRFGDHPPGVDAITQAAAEVGLPLEVADIAQGEAQAIYGRRLVLVRPDGSVAWRGDTVPADARRIVDVVRGMSAAGSPVPRRAYQLAEV